MMKFVFNEKSPKWKNIKDVRDWVKSFESSSKDEIGRSHTASIPSPETSCRSPGLSSNVFPMRGGMQESRKSPRLQGLLPHFCTSVRNG